MNTRDNSRSMSAPSTAACLPPHIEAEHKAARERLYNAIERFVTKFTARQEQAAFPSQAQPRRA
jgi:hypothetical protein